MEKGWGRKVGKDISVVVNRNKKFVPLILSFVLTDSTNDRFLWKFAQGTLKVYKTTGKNNYVMLCEPGYISFGGG